MGYIRSVIYMLALVGGVGVNLFVPAGERGWVLGPVAFSLLYLSLVPGSVYALFPNAVGRVPLQKAKKALGISAFFFALAYAWMGWQSGLFVAGVFPRWALLSGMGALVVLAILTVTSIKAIKHRMRPWWKPLHRSVYLAGWLAALHVAGLMQIREQAGGLRILFYVGVGILVGMQCVRFVRFVLGASSTPRPV